jgi:type I restriction enzyme M protein
MPTKTKKPATSENAPKGGKPTLEVRRDDKGKIWSHVRNKWLVETPEERVRQEYLCVLVSEYGFALDQIDEELEVTGRGSGHARADFVIWKTAQDKADGRNPLIVVECKSDNVTIRPPDYTQGDNYARIANAPFFVTHNSKETRFWRVRKDRMPGYLEEIENIPHADASDKEIEELLARLKVFKEDEFADLLHKCHNIIRNRDHKDPADAFDEIAKILFIKYFVENDLKARRVRKNVFTVEFLQDQIGEEPLEDLFQKTKKHYRADRIFEPDETLDLKPATGLAIVKELERYNLSATSEDIKGIAFERFLGKTFRGEIGQFFTPRPIVEFMVRMVDPKEGDVICDPASGSGGFLIRFFEIVREQIMAKADASYRAARKAIEADKRIPEPKKRATLLAKWEEIQRSLRQDNERSPLWYLANRCIYGTDANDRMARTSKMNMIMHGDGHGGVHHHDGFLNVNGIFEGRFDIILTNPPFGASVEPLDVVTDEQVAVSGEAEREYFQVFGDAYREAQGRVRAAKGKPIASLFELPKARGNGDGKTKLGKIKTEILFIERCLSLLKPGGRLGIVLPEGILNNPSLGYVRRFCEDRAFVRAVVSLPQDTFVSSGASVKASLLFMQKYTQKEKADYDRKKTAADRETRAKYAAEIQAETARLEPEIEAAKVAEDARKHKESKGALAQYQRDMESRIQAEGRTLLKERFPYPVFLYEAQRVGITATGEPDATELYEDAKLGLPAGLLADATALALYRAFRADPGAFLRGQA